MQKELTYIIDIVLLLGVLLSVPNVSAQNRGLFTVAGGVVDNREFTFSWSLGEPMSDQHIGMMSALPQYDIIVESDDKIKILDVEVFPTFVSSYINIYTPLAELPVTVELIAMNGALIFRSKVSSDIVRVSLQGLDASFYVLRVYNKKKQKLIKLVKR